LFSRITIDPRAPHKTSALTQTPMIISLGAGKTKRIGYCRAACPLLFQLTRALPALTVYVFVNAASHALTKKTHQMELAVA